MRELLARTAVIILALVAIAAFPGRTYYKRYKENQIEHDKLSVVNGLVNYHNKYGQYPVKEKALENKAPDRAIKQVQRKIKEGTIKNKEILNKVYEVDMNSLKNSIRVSNSSARYYMIKDNPYSAFCYEDTKLDKFKLEDKNKMYDFNNQISSSSIKIDGKAMNKINAVREVAGDMSLVGGEGDLYLVKVVGSKVYKIELESGITSIKDITDRYIVAVKNDKTLKVFSIKEVVN